MKKILLLVVLLVTLCMPVYAAEVSNVKSDKVLLAFKYYNTSTWGMTSKSVRENVIDKNVAPVLTKNNCEIITDEKYFDKLKSKGYTDVTSIERADLLETYKDDGFRYLIFIDMEPVRSASGFGYETSAHVKIVDMNSSSYLFNGKVAQMTKWGGGGTVANKLGKDIAKILEDRMFTSTTSK